MRIISDHRDYYDCVMAQGMDLTCVWVRRLEEVEFQGRQRWRTPGVIDGMGEWPFPKSPGSYWMKNDKIRMEQYMIGFCGKVHPVLEVSKSGLPESVFCRSLEDFDEFVEANFKKSEVDTYKLNKNKSWRWRRKGVGVFQNELREFFEECRQQEESFESIFVDNGCPVFVASYKTKHDNYSTIVYHGRREDPERPDDKPRILKHKCEVYKALLKDFEFYKVVDTQQAFQEIWQYISGILGLNNPHVPVPDNDTMIQIKGFDLKKSFRKEPSGKKRGRNGNGIRNRSQ